MTILSKADAIMAEISTRVHDVISHFIPCGATDLSALAPLIEEALRWEREILVSYIAHVYDMEGSDFLGTGIYEGRPAGLTDAQYAALMHARAEAGNE